mgnify:CR=1 FL=1
MEKIKEKFLLRGIKAKGTMEKEIHEIEKMNK